MASSDFALVINFQTLVISRLWTITIFFIIIEFTIFLTVSRDVPLTQLSDFRYRVTPNGEKVFKGTNDTYCIIKLMRCLNEKSYLCND